MSCELSRGGEPCAVLRFTGLSAAERQADQESGDVVLAFALADGAAEARIRANRKLRSGG
eukprot:1425003-Pleurochrysis_carterae.AAC.1